MITVGKVKSLTITIISAVCLGIYFIQDFSIILKLTKIISAFSIFFFCLYTLLALLDMLLSKAFDKSVTNMLEDTRVIKYSFKMCFGILVVDWGLLFVHVVIQNMLKVVDIVNKNEEFAAIFIVLILVRVIVNEFIIDMNLYKRNCI